MNGRVAAFENTRSQKCTGTYESVDGLEASLHRLVHGFSRDNAWCFQLDSGTLVGDDGALSVDGVTERVNDSAEHALADGHVNDRSGSLDDVAFLNLSASENGVSTVEGRGGLVGPATLTYRYPR